MIPDKVAVVLEKHGLEALEFESGSTHTAEMAAERIGVKVGQIAKSILLRGKDGRFFLVVCAGDRKIVSGKVKRLTGVKCSMASAEETLAVTGYPPGGVCPFAVEEAEILLDESLKEWDTVYPAAGNDATGVPVAPAFLQEITGAPFAELTAAAGAEID
jgi:prolyl-tRNA editing enzyme YbaK/EbsC (Cys-tRNA(Pro) deacylase)